MTAEKAKREWITKIIRGFSTEKKRNSEILGC